MTIQENEKMADNELDIDNELAEAEAAASLKPQSKPNASPESKPESMAKVLGALGSMPIEWWGDKHTEILHQYEKWKTNSAKGSAESNKATIKNKPSDAKGGSGPSSSSPMIKQPAVAQWNPNEDLQTIFAGDTITEEAQGQIAALFEAAVSMRTSLLEAELEERYESELTEAVSLFIEETTAGLDQYVEYAVDQWVAENEVNVVDTLRLENTEQFMAGLRDLFVESYIDVPEERLDIVREMSEKVVDLEAALDEVLAEKAELEQAMFEAAQEDAIASVAEGLTLSDSEKLKSLVENVEFGGDVESYTKKLKLVRESYFDKKTPPATSGSVDTLNEDSDGFSNSHAPVIEDPFVAAAARALGAFQR